VTAEPEPPRAAEPQEQSSRDPRLGFITALAIFAGVAIVLIYGYLARPGWIGSSGKQFWDYLDLLIVPAALALGVYWLNQRQTKRDQQAEDAQQERALAVESKRAQDEALQAYFDQMARLVIEYPLRQASPGDNLSTVVRAWTLTVLTRLEFDGLRKRSVVQFLYEAGLITKGAAVLDLKEAFLNFANLNDAKLAGVSLHGVSLTKAMMNGTELGQADLSDTMMFGANLLLANLRGADLSRAVLMSANTDSIPLSRSSVTRNPSFDSPGPKNANLELADLREVDLTDAYVSEEQLLSAASLEGATMPNGQKYEDWLKSKGGGEDRKNDGS
jgi:uncharacterized protein YjbI with pentapeptide repeats